MEPSKTKLEQSKKRERWRWIVDQLYQNQAVFHGMQKSLVLDKPLHRLTTWP